VPGISDSEFQEVLSGRPLLTIENDTSRVAVLDSANNDLMIVFWNPGQVIVPLLLAWQQESNNQIAIPIFKDNLQLTISSNQPLIAIISQAQWVVTVSDPSQSLRSVTLNFTATAFGVPATLWDGAGSKSLTFQLPQGESAGMSLSQSLL